ncbi:LmbE family N-acetylglucosaminyl deacetylase [Kineothrix alysoides]|uniref:LmbE family N-acetylglucosaminyl deacetylase n=1 Tax=Kineothrix alysoides TaxID=1469948 RepID=A0A4R1QQT5_9FIRM|nr:PIG-L deacetylase family protein [Kineothrix alysoides]TCL56196.1 LmbE family N-acetylglucosaminyl deacetylase [Kineothrix alysoides]
MDYKEFYNNKTNCFRNVSLPGKRILILSPHPDDEVIACGGSIIKSLKDNAVFHIVYLTNGERKITDKNDPFQRKKEALKVLQYFNVNSYEFLNLVDQNIEISSAIINRLTNIIENFKPDLICLPHLFDMQLDHFMTNILLFHAIKNKFTFQFNILKYEVWTLLSPNLVINITDQIDSKKEAMRIYDSQLLQYDYINHIDMYGRVHNMSRILWDENFVLLEYKFNIKNKFKNTTPWTHSEAFITMKYSDFISEIENLNGVI